MKKLTSVAFFAFFCLFTSAQWNIKTIGTSPQIKPYYFVVADGRNDNTARIYVSTRSTNNTTANACIYEWTYSNSIWTYQTIETGLNNIVSIAVGSARNDGVNRLYAVEFHSTSRRVIEYAWNGSSWTKTVIDNSPGQMLGVKIGDARGDGIKRLYVGGLSTSIIAEYTWNGSTWAKTNVSTSFASEGVFDIGNGRNDGTPRLFSPGSNVAEFSWNGSAYSQTTNISTLLKYPESLVIAKGRNDDTNRIYYQDADGSWESTWDGTAWTKTKFAGRKGRSFFTSGITKADGKTYLYNTDIGSPLREYAYNSTKSNYDSTDISALSGATGTLAIGIGRNDDTVRIYTGNVLTGQLYEATHITPYVVKKTNLPKLQEKEDVAVNIFPNPTSNSISIVSHNGELNQIEVLNASGLKVMSFTAVGKEFNIDFKSLQTGIYFISCRLNTSTKIYKVIVL